MLDVGGSRRWDNPSRALTGLCREKSDWLTWKRGHLRTDQQMRPPDQQMRPPDQQMRPPAQQMRPPDQPMHPPAQQMHPPDQPGRSTDERGEVTEHSELMCDTCKYLIYGDPRMDTITENRTSCLNCASNWTRSGTYGTEVIGMDEFSQDAFTPSGFSAS